MKSIKYILLCCILFSALLTGCTSGDRELHIETQSTDYEYSEYQFKDDEAQYYMKSNAAAAESGYYYIAQSPVNNKNASFIYYFDMSSKKALPLCSKLDCDHTDESCDAYMSENACLGKSIWYYRGRIYMIERTAEKDILVSYDKNGRDKKSILNLSVEGLSVNITSSVFSKACVSHGKLYYFTAGEDTQYLYEVSLTDGSKPTLIKQYQSAAAIKETMSLYAIEDRVYINLTSGITEKKNNFIVDCYDISTKKISNVVDYMSDSIPIRGAINDWNTDICFDKANNMYFVSVSDGDYIVNKLNLETKQSVELYVIQTVNFTEGGSSVMKSDDTDYIHLEGYDGQYLYIYKSVNIAIRSKTKDQSNDMLVVDTNGKLVDTIPLISNQDFKAEHNIRTSDNIPINYLGGDFRYLLVTTDKLAVSGIEIKDTWMKKYTDLEENDSKKVPDVCLVGAFNKNQLGTGNYIWSNITPQ